jgi:hypothetical protein
MSDTPTQPIILDADGTVRFRENPVVRLLLDEAQKRGFGLNELAILTADRPDLYPDDASAQLAELIGYSLAGYHELDYVSDERALAASEAARRLVPGAGGCRDDGCPIHTRGGGGA